MTTQKTAESIMVRDYQTGMQIFRSPHFGVDHPFRATRQVFGPSVVDTEAETHVARKRAWMAEFLPSSISSPEVQRVIDRATEEGFDDAKDRGDLLQAAVYIPNRVLLLLLGLNDIDPIEHHERLRGITDFLETNQRSPKVAAARDYLQSGPFRETRRLFGGLSAEQQVSELLLFSYAAGETTFVAMKCMMLLWAQDPAAFETRIKAEGLQAFLGQNLREDPPLGIATRYCKADTTIGGISFAKGDLVHVDIVATNQQCPISARGQGDFTFGAGKHSCPGHLLAKAELEAVAKRLLQMDASKYEVTGEFADQRPVNFRDPGAMSIRRIVEAA